MLRTNIIRDFADLGAIADDWQRLWCCSKRREVFGTFSWARAWWRAYGQDRRVCTPVVLDGNRIIGIWPLYLYGNKIHAIGMPRSDSNDLLCELNAGPTVLIEALTLLDGLPENWKSIQIENVPDNSALAAAVAQVPKQWGRRTHFAAGQRCSRAVFRGHSSFVQERLLQSKHLQRKHRRLSRFGSILYGHIEERDEIYRYLPAFFEQHIGRRALLGEKSLFDSERDRDFYRYLVEELDPKDSLRFGVLTVGQELAGFHFGFEVDGRYVCYKPSFAPELAKWSPGEVLFYLIFRYVSEHHLDECDFTVGDEPFKERFANYIGHTFNLTIFRGGLTGLTGVGFLTMKNLFRTARAILWPKP